MCVGPSGRKRIGYNGDMVIGFYATHSVRFDVYIGSDVVSSYDMCKGEFVYAIANRLPMVVISFHRVLYKIGTGRHSIY